MVQDMIGGNVLSVLLHFVSFCHYGCAFALSYNVPSVPTLPGQQYPFLVCRVPPQAAHSCQR